MPVGSERVSKGYVMVKVTDEHRGRGAARLNWKPKSVVVYEGAHGPVPDGCRVFFADGDRRNFDPDNLVAVPVRLTGSLHENADELGLRWNDRESLLACMAYAELNSAILDAENDCACRVCGRRFVNKRRKHGGHVCPECLKAGHRPTCPPGSRGTHGSGVCKDCGSEFDKDRKNQVKCPDCIERERKRPSRRKFLAGGGS